MKLPESLWQSCLIHRARNLLALFLKHAQGEVKADYWSIFDEIEPGAGARRPGRSPPAGPKRFAAKWRKLFPATVECLEEDFEHLITYLRFPKEHHKRIRHSNFIERTFGETADG